MRNVRWTRGAAVASALLAVGLAVPAAAPARAAGDAVMDVSVVAVDASTGAPITSTSPGQYDNRVAFRVDFSCLVAACDNATVHFDPTQLDPNHNLYRLLHQSGFTPPVSGGSVTGSATAGYTVALGNLAAGASGSFVLEYRQQPEPNGHAWNAGEYNNWAVSNFPIGFELVQAATANADTATAPTTVSSAPVVWNNTIPNPTLALGAINARAGGLPTTVETDRDYTYAVFMGSGCAQGHGYGTGGRARAVFMLPELCAQDYTVTHQLPPGVELVSATGDYTVSGTVATGLVLTWEGLDTWAEFNNNSAGWQGTDSAHNGGGASPRTVTARFPRENFAPAGQPCDYTATSGSWQTGVSVTYISMPGEAGEVRTGSLTTGARTIRCVDPFRKAIADPKVSTFDGDVRLADGSSPIRVPLAGEPDNEKWWAVTVGNQANVEGEAVVTDNTLDLADAPVYRIEASPAGASVDWTATDGTTTVSGTSDAPVDAPDGFRFATAVVTSPPLAGPNQFPTGTTRTNFVVTFRYRVSSDAPIGERRTNQASAVMTYPGYAQLADVPLTVAPHTITFATPFGKSRVLKTSNGTLTNGEYRITVPNSGAGSLHGWVVDVRNGGNVPGVPVVTDDQLSGPGGLPVTRIGLQYHRGNGAWTWTTGTVQYTLDDGTVATVAVPANGILDAPAGRRFVSAVVTGPPIEGPNSRPERLVESIFRVVFWYPVAPGAPVDAVLTNTASGTLTYPGYDIAPITNTTSATARLVAAAVPPVTFNATVTRQPLPGGATQAGTTTDVTFTMGGSTANVPAARDITPHYVFVAPEGWHITPGSASFPAGSVPVGVTFEYRTVTVGGVAREAVVATWPSDVVFGENRTLPTMTVVARPGPTVPAGTVSRPDAYIGNSRNDSPAADVFTSAYTDAADLDGDGIVAERFARATNTNAGTTVASVPAMQVLKEICLPDTSQPDGCRWFADPDNVLGVAPNSSSIRYRLTVTNVGNTTLRDIVGYDILPYVGDTGTSNPTGGTPRGSTFQEQLSAVTTPTNGATVTFSGSVQPCRPEVDSTVPGCVDDWVPASTGAQAIRLARAGALAPDASFSMEYTAAVIDAPSNGAVACNSIAVAATGLGTVSEPAPVCAAVAETDLMIVAGTPQLQVGRPGLLPFTVTNLGGAPSSQGEVEIAIPAGVTVTDLTPDGWACTAIDAADEPVYGTAVGPVTLTCTPDEPLLLQQPVALDIPVVLTAEQMTVRGEVSGRLFDSDLTNNEDDMAILAAPAAGDIGVTKDDGVVGASPGDELTYTVTVTNPLVHETLAGAVLTDTLPPGLAFVSASAGGVHDAGVVTWNLPAIAPGGAITVTVTARVLPTIAQASLDNVAVVNAPDPADQSRTLTGTGHDVDTVTTHPELSLDKASTLPTYAAVGETITYTFAIENRGDVTLTGVTVSDPLAGLSTVTYTWPGPAGALAPGQTATATATYAVTQADIDAGRLVNTARATGGAPNGGAVEDSDTHTVTSTAVPHLTVTKDVTPAVVPEAGQSVAYTITVVNDGPITLQDVTISDPRPGLSTLVYTWPAAAGVLAPGAQVVATATYTVTQADADAGQLSNTATGAATTTAAGPVSGEDTAIVTIPANPGIDLVKDGDYAEGTTGEAGETLEYAFTFTNTGNVTLTGVTISDPLAGLSTIAYTWPGPPGVLAPGQVATATAEYVVTQADVDGLAGVTNTATVSGTPPAADPVVDDDTVTMDTPATREIQVTKTATIIGAAPVAAGDEVEYRFAVTNLGDLTLYDVTIGDPLPGLSDLAYTWPGAAGVLAPGEVVIATARYALTQADVDRGSVANTATTTGTPPAGEPVTDEDTATVVLPPEPGVALAKTATLVGDPPVVAGDEVAYEFAVTNAGNVTLDDVTIGDPLPDLSDLAYTWPGAAGVLAPGEVMIATARYTLTQADVDRGSVANTATVRATTPGEQFVTDEDTATVVLPPEPGVALAKTATLVGDPPVVAGDEVAYEFAVTNTGNVTLHDVALADPLPGLSAITLTWPGAAGVLAPGEVMRASATYAVAQADIDAGRVVNTATAGGTTPGDQGVSDDDTATVVLPSAAAISFVKTASHDAGAWTAGRPITYRFTVTNTGNVTLHDLRISDPLRGLPAVDCPATDLAPGAQVVCTTTYAVTQADIDAGAVTNTATATATPPAGPAISSDSTVTVPLQQRRALSLTKSLAEATFTVGTNLHFRFTVTNTSNVTVTDLIVNDPMVGLSPITCPTTTLTPGQTVTCTAAYVATAADVTAGRISNTATATARSSGAPPLVSEPSTVHVEVVSVPPPAPTTPTPPPTRPSPAVPGELPATGGGNLTGRLLLATALLLAGVTTSRIGRRRRRSA